MAGISVRYIVDDVDRAIEFYTGELGFEAIAHPAQTHAIVRLGELRLTLGVPGGGPGAGAASAEGEMPTPGGWNRIQLEVADIEAKVEELKRRGAGFRGDLVDGVGGRRILLEDPAGNLIELVQPTVGGAPS